jgi:F0F1-type ATP synthase membrane subunit b/b'
VANAKQLQKAEQLMDRTTRHLADMVRVASEQQRNTMQRALEHLNAVHSDMLAVVFAK